MASKENMWPTEFAPAVVGCALGSSALSSYAIALEAWRRGLAVTFNSHDLRSYRISDEERRVSFNFSRPISTSSPKSHEILNDKWKTNQALSNSGIPSPRCHLIEPCQVNLEDLEKVVDDIGYPVVIKPTNGSFGRGVYADLNTWEEFLEAYDHLREDLNPAQVLIEKHHYGEDYRILVVGNSVVGAVLRIPANVVGDGISTISELIEKKNSFRRKNPFLSAGLIKPDFEVQKCLTSSGFEFHDILPEGEQLFLRRVANASAGGDVVDVTDDLPEEIMLAAVSAAKAIPGLVLAGVDVLYQTGEPASPGNFVIIEMNSRPHIGVNMYPSIGMGRNAPAAIIDTLFPGTHALKSSGMENTRFNVGAISRAIRSGVASAVTLPQYESASFTSRKYYKFTKTERIISSGEKQLLQDYAARQKVSGKLKLTPSGQIVLHTAGRDGESTNRVMRKLATILDQRPFAKGTWEGVVTAGFSVS